MSKAVLLLTQYMSTGGLERMVMQHALQLKALHSWQPYVFAYDNSIEEADLLPIYKKENIPTFLCQKKPGFSFSTLYSLISFCFKHKIRVIHTHDIGPLLYASLAKILSFGFIKIIHTQHSFAHLNERKRNRFYERYFSSFASKLCVVAPALADAYKTIGVAKECVLIPNGVSFSNNQRATFEQRKLNRLQLNYNSPRETIPSLASRRWLLCLGRMSEGKGQGTVLALWNQLPESLRKNWALLFIGPEKSAGFVARLQRQVAAEDFVSFLPATQEPHKWLLQSDLFISASEFEGMPLTVVEALGYGLPCILSKITGHEIFAQDALLFSLTNSAAAAKSLAERMESIERDEINVNSSAIREKFSGKQMTQKYVEQYEKLLGAT